MYTHAEKFDGRFKSTLLMGSTDSRVNVVPQASSSRDQYKRLSSLNSEVGAYSQGSQNGQQGQAYRSIFAHATVGVAVLPIVGLD